MGNDTAYKKSEWKPVDTRRMTEEDFWDYVLYLLKEARLIERLRKKRQQKATR